MESKKELEALLRKRLSPEHSEIADVDPMLVADARRLIISRKKPLEERNSFIDMLLGLFTLRVKLYQAGLSTLLLGGLFFYFVKVSEIGTADQAISHNTTENSAVKSSTVLTSIFTLVARD